ncbi:MAG: Ig-like domain-containing protein [Armatimonadota bacterium]
MRTLFTRVMLILVALLALSPAWALLTWDDFDDDKPRDASTPFVISEGLDRSYTNELVTYSVTFPANTTVNSLRLHDEDDVTPPLTFVTYQLSDAVINEGVISSARISFWVDSLPAEETRHYRLYHGTRTDYSAPPFSALGVTHTDITQSSVDISNGVIGIRLWGGTQTYNPAADPSTLPGVLRGVKGTDNTWRGTGAMVADTTVTSHALTVVEDGALWRTYKQVMTFTGGGTYDLHVKVFPDTDFVQLDESGNNVFEQTWVDGSVGFARENTQLLRLNDFNPNKFLWYTTFAQNIQSTDMNTANNQYHLTGKGGGECWNGGGWGGAYATDAGKQDVIGVVPVKPGSWAGNSTWITFNTDSTNLQELRLSMAVSERHSLLVVTNKTKAVLSQAQIDATKAPKYIVSWGHLKSEAALRITPDACYLWKLRNTWGDFPLDKVKDWMLTYDDTEYAHPRVLFGAPDNVQAVMAAAHDRLVNDPLYAFQRQTAYINTTNGVPALEYLYYGSVQDLFRSASPYRLDWDYGDATGVVKEQMALGYPSGIYILTTGQAEDISVRFADVLWDALGSTEQSRWSRYALALAYILRDPDNWGNVTYTQGQLAPYGNFNSCRWIGLAMAGVFFDGHPEAEAWRNFAKSEMDQETAATLSDDGVYLEALSNYFPFWWQNTTRVSWALQRHGWGSYASNAKYQKAAQFLIDTLTPPDATFHQDATTHVGKRMIPPVGHHPGAGYRNYGQFAWSVSLFGHGTTIGDQSQWAWNQNGQYYGDHYLLPVNMFNADPSAQEETPELASNAWDDYGFLLRNHAHSGKESYFLLKNSRVGWHHEADEGAFHMFGKGVLLAADGLNLMSEEYAGASPCPYCDAQKTDSTDRLSQRSAFHHNLITFRGPTNDGNVRGQWQAFQSYDTLEYGFAQIPKVSTNGIGAGNNSYDRRCLLVKSVDPDGPEYYVIQDTTNGPDLPEWNLDVHSPSPTLKPDGKAGWVTFPGFTDPGFGVAMDTVFVTPSNPDIWSEQGYIYPAYLDIWGVKGHSLIHATPAAALGQTDYWVQYSCTDNSRSAGLSPDLQYVVNGGDSTDKTVRLWDRKTGNLLRTFPTMTDMVWACAVSPNNQIVAGGNTGHLTLWRRTDGVQLFDFSTPRTYAIAFSADSTMVAAGDNDGHVRIYDTSTGSTLQNLNPQTGTVRGVAFSPDGSLIAVAGNSRATIWDVATGSRLLNLSDGTAWQDGAAGVCFSPDASTLLVGGIPNAGAAYVTLWDATIPQQTPYTRTGYLWRQGGAGVHNNYVRVVKFSPDGAVVYEGGNDSWHFIRDAADGSVIRQLPGMTARIEDAVWTADGQEVWSVSENVTTTFHWRSFARDPNANTIGWPGGVDHYIVKAQSDNIRSVAFSHDLNSVATGGDTTDKNVKLWNRNTGRLSWASAAGTEAMWAVAISPNNQFVAAGNRYQVRIHNGTTGAVLYSLPTSSGMLLNALDFSPDSGTLAVGCQDGNVRLYSTSTGNLLSTITPGFALKCVSFSPDGARLAVGGTGNVATWNVSTGQQEIICTTNSVNVWEDTVNAIGWYYSSDGNTKRLVAGGVHNANTDVKLTAWDATVPGGTLPVTITTPLWRIRGSLAGGVNDITAAEYSPDGRYILTANRDNWPYLWAADTGEIERTLSGTSSGILDARWAPDGADFSLGTSTGMSLRINTYAGVVTFPFLTIHYPRYQGTASPTITSIADGKGASVQYAWGEGGTDTILMSNNSFTYNAGGINFTGKVAVVRNMNGERWMTLVDGTSLTYNGHTLNSPGVYHFNPVVLLTAPAQATTVTAPVTLTATASYAGGTVTKVEFYDGENKLGEDTVAPYSYSWMNPTLGAHTLRATAIGNDATVGTSEPINVTVVNP